MEADRIIKDLIKAWESLPGDKHYHPKTLEEWLKNEMKPSIDKARAYIKKIGNN